MPKIYVCIGHHIGPFQGWIDPNDATGNGALSPRFDRANAERLVSQLLTNHLQGDLDAPRAGWRGTTVVIDYPNHVGTDGYRPDRVEPDADGLYAIGAQRWMWQECQRLRDLTSPAEAGQGPR